MVLQGSGSGSQSGTISSAGTVNLMSLVKTGSGTWNLSGANTYTGTTTVNGGLLTVSGAAGGIAQSTALTVSGGTVQLDDSAQANHFSNSRLGNQPISLQGSTLQFNLGNVSGGTETVGSLTAAMGENTLALTASAGSGILSGGPLARLPGATLNFTGALSGSNGMVFSGMASGSNFIDAGTFVNGADYAVYDAGGYLRAMVPGPNAADYALSVAASRHVLLTAPATAQPSITLLTLSLSGASTGFSLAAAQTLTLSAGGILKTGGGAATISGGAGISTTSEYVLRADTAGDQLTIATPLTGGTGLTKSGLGTLVLGVAGNSYSGATTIDAGTLKTTAAGAIPATSPLLIANAATLDLGGQSQTVAGITLDDGAIQNSGSAAALTLGGNAAGVTYAGGSNGSSISGGVLNLASAAALSASHTFAVARGQGTVDLDIAANIADGSANSQTLVKTGNGILQLSGVNSFSGGTLVQAGTLALGGNSAIPATSSLTLSGGTLNLGGYANTAATLVLQNGSITGAGSFSAAAVELQNGTLAGSLVGSGSLRMTTAGVVTITSSNSYTGGTTLSSGTLVVSADNNLGAATGALTLNGGMLQVQGTSFTSTTRPVATTANGGAISVADPNNTLTLAAQNLSGSGPFAKAGQGTLQLGGSIGSTAITVQDGILQLTGSASQLAANPALSLWNVATFSLTNNNESVSTINLTGGTVNTGAAVLRLIGSVNYAHSIWPATIEGNLSLGSSAGTFSITQGSSTDLTVTANISGSPAGGLLKTGNGLLTLSGSNTYSGGTVISQGTLAVQSDTNLSTGPLQLSGGAVFDITGNAAFSSSKGVDLNSSSTIQVDNTAGATLSGTIFDSGQLTKAGAGTLILTGSNTYSGGTVINSGTLQIGSGGTSGSFGAGAMTDNSALSFNRSDVYTVPLAVSGSGTLAQLGPGTLVLNAADSYTGQTTISGGALRAASGGGLPSGSNLTLNGGVLESSGSFTRSVNATSTTVQWSNLGGGFAANGGPLTVNLGGSGATITWSSAPLATQIHGTLMFGSATANNETVFVNPINLNGANRTVQVATGLGGDFAEMTGVLSDTSGVAGLAKTGNGLLVLTASNTYQGPTTVSGGTLQIGNGGSGASIGNTSGVTDNATLFFNHADNVAFSQVISGSGSLIQAGPGTLLLSNPSSSFTGGTMLNAGALIVANSSGSALGSGNLTINGGTLMSPAGNTGMISGVIQDGSGASIFAGGAAGTGSFGSLTAGGLSLTNASNLLFAVATTTSLDQLQLGNGTISFAGSGEANLLLSTTGSLANGTYKLIGFGSAGTTNTGDFSLGMVGGGSVPSNYSLQLKATELDLVVGTGYNNPNYTLTAAATSHAFIVGGSSSIAVTLASTGGIPADNLNYTGLTATVGAGGTISGPSVNGSLTPGNSAANTGLVFTSNTPGSYLLTPSVTVTGSNGTTPVLTSTGTDAVTVWDHSNASLSLTASQTTQTINFGNVLLGATVPSQSFTIYNQAANTSAAYTTNLKLTGFASNGDAALSTTLATFNALPAGTGNTYTASLNTSNYTTTGAKTVTMSASQLADDSSLPGAGNNNLGGMTITLEGNVGNAAADNSNSPSSFGVALTAVVAPNASYANLASAVTTTTGSGGYGLLAGSTATILAGTNNGSSSQTISMQWRTPTLAEEANLTPSGSGAAISNSALQPLDAGVVPDGGLIVAAGQTSLVSPESQLQSLETAETSAILASGGSSSGSSDPATSSSSAPDAPAALAAASQPYLSPVPEPNTLLLLLAASGGGLLWHIRRRRASARRKGSAEE